MAKVNVVRTLDGDYVGTNERGARVAIGSSTEDGVFSPVELLLIALGGCELVTIEPLTAKRGHRLNKLAVTVTAEKVEPTKLGAITSTYEIELPEDDERGRRGVQGGRPPGPREPLHRGQGSARADPHIQVLPV